MHRAVPNIDKMCWKYEQKQKININMHRAAPNIDNMCWKYEQKQNKYKYCAVIILIISTPLNMGIFFNLFIHKTVVLIIHTPKFVKN
jgi:hypothetical protein